MYYENIYDKFSSLIKHKSVFGGGGGGDAGARAAEEANRLTAQGIAELRRQFTQTQANVQPFIQAGTSQLPGLQEGATIGGFGARLAELFSGGALDPLIEERTRATKGALSSAGLTRSGTAIEELSAIPQDIALFIENLLTGRSQNLAAGGQNAALGLGGIGAQTSGNIASLFQSQGSNVFQGGILDAQRQAGIFGDLIGGLGALGGGLASGIGAAGGAAAFFSDRDLKENIEPIGKIGALTLHQWDWIPETKDMVINLFPTMGFIYDEVKALYPEFVKEICGFGSVDYLGLLDRMEGELVLAEVA